MILQPPNIIFGVFVFCDPRQNVAVDECCIEIADDPVTQDAAVGLNSFHAYTGLPGQVSFSALSGVSLPSLNGSYVAATPSAHSSGETYKVKDRFALPGPTWCQQFSILLRRILWTRRFEILSLPDVSLVLVIAVVTGKALILVLFSFQVNACLTCVML